MVNATTLYIKELLFHVLEFGKSGRAVGLKFGVSDGSVATIGIIFILALAIPICWIVYQR